MKKSKIRVYLDYMIYNKIQEQGNVKKFANFNCNYYLSVNHIEEYYKAKVNDLQDENAIKLDSVKSIMQQLSPNGILNPQKGLRIIHKRESFDDCLMRIKQYNTQNIIEDTSIINQEIQAQKSKELQKVNKENTNNYNLNYEEIWNVAAVKEQIEKYTWPTTKEYYKLPFSFYGSRTKKLFNSYHVPDFSFQYATYSVMENNFQWLELAIDELNHILCECGYHRDREKRAGKSGAYDVANMIYSTYCNYFVTDDKNLIPRAKAIFYYLKIPTEVLTLDKFLEKMEPSI